MYIIPLGVPPSFLTNSSRLLNTPLLRTLADHKLWECVAPISATVTNTPGFAVIKISQQIWAPEGTQPREVSSLGVFALDLSSSLLLRPFPPDTAAFFTANIRRNRPKKPPFCRTHTSKQQANAHNNKQNKNKQKKSEENKRKKKKKSEEK